MSCRVGLSYLHHNYGFLYDVADTCSNQIEKDVYTTLSRLVDLDSSLSDRLDTLSNKINIYF